LKIDKILFVRSVHLEVILYKTLTFDSIN